MLNPKSILPTKSGCLTLLGLGLIIGLIVYGLLWVLMNIPEGSNSSSSPPAATQPPQD